MPNNDGQKDGAVVLVSGGLDSMVVAALAVEAREIARASLTSEELRLLEEARA